MLLLLCEIQRIIINTHIDSAWHEEIAPDNFRISSTVDKITNVVEVKETGYDIYANGRHNFYTHILDVSQVNQIRTGEPAVQLSVGKVSYKEKVCLNENLACSI